MADDKKDEEKEPGEETAEVQKAVGVEKSDPNAAKKYDGGPIPRPKS